MSVAATRDHVNPGGEDESESDDVQDGYYYDEYDKSESDDDDEEIRMPQGTMVVFTHAVRESGVTRVFYDCVCGSDYVVYCSEREFVADMTVADNAPARRWQEVARGVVTPADRALTKPGVKVMVEYPAVLTPPGVRFEGLSAEAAIIGFQPVATRDDSRGANIEGTVWYYGDDNTIRRAQTRMHWTEPTDLESIMTRRAALPVMGVMGGKKL